jgi:hypothetical protein
VIVDQGAGGTITPPAVPSLFSPDRLLAVINQTMPTVDIPPGHRGATLLAVNEHGAEFEVNTKLDESGNWTLAGDVGYSWDDGVGARIQLKGTW